MRKKRKIYLGQNDKPSDEKYWKQFKGLTFDQFWDKIGRPVKHGEGKPVLGYEKEILEQLAKTKYIRVKKATGLGITEFVLRWIAWKCTTDNDYQTRQIDVSVILITGNRIDLAEQLIRRIKAFFPEYNFESKATVCEINGARLEAFPSHHLASARGINPFIVFLDEADFFPIGQQEESRSVSERYIAKTDPYIIMVSTPNMPTGLYDRMDKENPCMYKLIEHNYEVGQRDGIFTNEEIQQAMLSPSFEREYNLQYGIGIGNIFPYELVEMITENYDLTIGNGQKCLFVDPAFGSSNFAIMGAEKRDGKLYITEANEYERPSPSAMLDLLVKLAPKYGKNVRVDSAHAGLIRDLVDAGINATEMNFRVNLSTMTIEASQAVKEKRVVIHPVFKDLLAQLKSVTFNDKGHPDKKKLNFDLGDCFLMANLHFLTSKVTIIKV